MTLAEEEEPSLLDAVRSVEVAVLETVLVSEPLVGAVTVTVKLVVNPMAQLVMVGQVTAPLPLVPPLEALTKVALEGRLSLTMMFVAVLGPWLVTVMV